MSGRASILFCLLIKVMWPSVYIEGGKDSSLLHERTEALAKQLLGEDMVFDFDMLISKDGGSPAETPWHQDESYWPDLPDKRALSFWSERNLFPHVQHS